MRIEREWERVDLLNRQIQALEAERREAIRAGRGRAMAQVRQLVSLQGIGSNSAWLYVMEFFGWRRFRSRKQVGSLAGLTPTPHQSGEESREQGIGRDGNRHVRARAIEIAWGWLRFQPRVRSRAGISAASAVGAVGCAASGSWRSRASS
jgi:transposase